MTTVRPHGSGLGCGHIFFVTKKSEWLMRSEMNPAGQVPIIGQLPVWWLAFFVEKFPSSDRWVFAIRRWVVLCFFVQKWGDGFGGYPDDHHDRLPLRNEKPSGYPSVITAQMRDWRHGFVTKIISLSWFADGGEPFCFFRHESYASRQVREICAWIWQNIFSSRDTFLDFECFFTHIVSTNF